MSGGADLLRSVPPDPTLSKPERPAGIDEAFTRYTSDPGFLPGDWTDAYLAAFAVTAGCRLVSFDAGFVRYPGLDRRHLSPTG